MTAPLHPPLHAPLLAPEHAAKLLDEVIYERVLSFIDLDALYEFEQELWCAYEEAGVTNTEDVPRIVKEMVDRALMRFCEEPRRYVDFRGESPLPFGDCELCDEEPADAKRRKRKAS